MGNLVTDRKRLWPGGIIPFDFAAAIDVTQVGFDVTAPVGFGVPGGANRPDDVRNVQRLLNRIRPADGGPDPKLDVGGKADGPTVAAIRKLQKARFGWEDGRVDRTGPTLVELTIDEVDDSGSTKGTLLNAVHAWNKLFPGRMKWERRTRRQANFVAFELGNFNESKSLGMNGGRQVLLLNAERGAALVQGSGVGGTVQGVFTHEMAHAAGLGHEHQRTDRDQFVTVLLENVREGREKDFIIPPDPRFPKFLPCTPVPPYDFESTMHYFTTQACLVGTQLPTVVAKGTPRTLGSFSGLSQGDVAALKQAYR